MCAFMRAGLPACMLRPKFSLLSALIFMGACNCAAVGTHESAANAATATQLPCPGGAALAGRD